MHILTAHSDEVWFLAFSRDGSRLASGAKDGEIIVWDMKVWRYDCVAVYGGVDWEAMGVNYPLYLSQGDCPQIQHKLRGQADGIAHLAWSPDDSLLLSCGREDSPEAIVFSTQVSHLLASLDGVDIAFLSVDWRGEVSCAKLSRGQSYLWSLVT